MAQRLKQQQFLCEGDTCNTCLAKSRSPAALISRMYQSVVCSDSSLLAGAGWETAPSEKAR
eukprot:2467536-Rhodomonas_salina.5